MTFKLKSQLKLENTAQCARTDLNKRSFKSVPAHCGQFTISVECPSLNFNLKRYLKLHQLQVYLKVESLLMLFSALQYHAFEAAAVT